MNSKTKIASNIINATIEHIQDIFTQIDWQDASDEIFMNIDYDTKESLDYSDDSRVIITNIVRLMYNFLDSFKNEEDRGIIYEERVQSVSSMREADHKIDIEVYNQWGEDCWAQARYLVHGYDDVAWTNSEEGVARFIIDSLLSLKRESG